MFVARPDAAASTTTSRRLSRCHACHPPCYEILSQWGSMLPDLNLESYASNLRRELPDILGDLDWRSRSAFQRICAAARPAIDADRAVAELGNLFPVDEIREIIEAGDLRIVLPLFVEGWTNAHAVLLHLGDDLSCCEDWLGHAQLAKRLRQTAEYDGARFEVGLWAGAARERLPVQYLDPMPGGGGDILIVEEACEIHVEGKSVGDSRVERNRDHLDSIIGTCVAPHLDRVGGGYRLIVILARELIEAACSDNPDMFERRTEPFWQSLNDWCSFALSPLAAGIPVDVPNVGQVRLVEAGRANDGFGTEIVGIPRIEFDKEVARALRPAKSAAHQLASSGVCLRVVAVWTGTTSCPAGPAVDVARRMVREHPERFVALDWIVFINSHTQLADWKTNAEPLAVRGGQTDPKSSRWLRALTRWQSCS